MGNRVAKALAVIDEAVERFNPSHVLGLYSGGHDSFCATHIASLHPKFSGAVHINTTCGIKETRVEVHKNCADRGWVLKEYTAPTSYRDIVLKDGFPGPGAHQFMYIRLKERCIDRLIREHKTHTRDRILLITGVRLAESTRRMGHVEPIVRFKTRVWVAPILDWTADDKIEHMTEYALPENPVVKALCMSGECLCGAFAKPGELDHIELFYPEAAAMLRGIELEARRAGVHHKWGTRPPRKADPRQMQLCWSCEAKHP